MLFQVISDYAHISGITALIAVLIGFFHGTIVIYKYIRTRDILLLYFALSVFFTISPWFPSGLGYFFYIITGELLNYQFYVLIGTMLTPIAILSWLMIYMSIINPNRKKIVIMIFLIFSIAFELYLFYFSYLSPNAPVKELLGIIDDPLNPMDIDYKGFVLIYLTILVITTVITGVHFSIASLKIKDNPALVWKGRFLLVAFISFGFSAIFDAMVEMGALFLIFIRILIAISTFFFYIGFILPNWIKNLLSIEQSLD